MATDSLTMFLQYGYGTSKDGATSLLTLYAATLAFIAAFSDKVINIGEAPKNVRWTVNSGFGFLVAAIFVALLAINDQGLALSKLSLWTTSTASLQSRLSAASSIIDFGNLEAFWSRILYVVSLIIFVIGSVRMNKHRESKEAQAAKEEQKAERVRQAQAQHDAEEDAYRDATER